MATSTAAGAASEFWTDHEAWKAKQLAPPIELLVAEPEETGSFLTSYTTYKVVTNPQAWSVRRRFSDFEWLKDTLSKRYVGLLIPALPSKRALGKSDSGFVRERMAGLNMFLARVACNPYLRNDTSFVQFLSVSDAREWDGIKDRTKPGELNQENVCMVKWRLALEKYRLPAESERNIAEVRSRLEALEPMFREAATSAKRLAEKSAAFSAELAVFHTAFEGIRRGQVSTSEPEPGSAEADSASLLEKAGMGVSAWTKIAEFQPKMLASMMATTLAYEARQIANMRQLLKQRDDMLAAKHKAERTLDKHNADLFAVRGRGSSKESAKAKQVADDRVTVERAGFVVDIITKALLFSELDRLSQEKADLIRDMFAQYAVSGFRLAQKEGALWKTMSTQMGIDPATAAARAKTSMDIFTVPTPDDGSKPAAGAGAGGR